MADYPDQTMPRPDEHRRARAVWAAAAALVTLAVLVPLVVLVLRDEPGNASAGASPTPSASPSAEPTSTDVRPSGTTRALFFGDSYFIGGGYTDESTSMARLSGNRLGWSAEINGGGGTGFVQANPAYDLPNFLGQIADGAFDVGRRSWVVVEGGNDDRLVDQARVNKNARRVLRIAQRRFPDATVVLVGPLDTDGDWADTKPVVRSLRKAAAKRDVAFVNAQRWLAGHYDQIGPDFVHPTPKGHRICARKLTRALRALGA